MGRKSTICRTECGKFPISVDFNRITPLVLVVKWLKVNLPKVFWFFWKGMDRRWRFEIESLSEE